MLLDGWKRTSSLIGECFDTPMDGDERGLPAYAVIEIEDENDVLVKAYKQEKLFTADDYRRAALYQAKLASEHKELADYYSNEFKKRQENPL